jgi:hypothetical protein
MLLFALMKQLCLSPSTKKMCLAEFSEPNGFGAATDAEEAMTITGGCRCGAVRYTIEAERITARHCWCRDCQYIGAGSGTVNVFFPSETSVEVVLSDFASRAASNNLVHWQFCPTCGTPVFTQSEARLHLIGVRAGTLDDPEIGRPGMTIWISRPLPGFIG